MKTQKKTKLSITALLLCVLSFITASFLVSPVYAAPGLSAITTNLSNNSMASYDKLELTFSINNSVASNTLWPYTATPPAGIPAGTGITVNAVFTDPQGQAYTQPGFYYQEFVDNGTVGNDDWIYPTSTYKWKVRFAPTKVGAWKYKISAQDAGGMVESAEGQFTVTASANKGFIRVSPTDNRYFEFADGTYFPALGYNLNGRRIDWINPSKNQPIFQTLKQNNIQLIRHWLSQWSMFGSAWSPWKSLNTAHQAQEPDARIRHDTVFPFAGNPAISRPGSDVFLWLSHNETGNTGQKFNFTPCVVYGWEDPKIPLTPNKQYRIRVRFKDAGITGPKVSGQPFGFVVKHGGFFAWNENTDPTDDCYSSGKGSVLAATYGSGSVLNDPEYPGWKILENTMSSGSLNFFDKLYLAIENATAGNVYVDYVWVEEVLGNGQYGPNVIPKPWMAHHQYIDQRASYNLDKTLEYAKENDVYLKLTIMEKKDYVLNIFNPDGTTTTSLPKDIDHILFYGNGRETAGKTKVRFLQEAWWRYLQARWGYSPNIHSWELFNEGSPDATRHTLADELGKYMHQFINKHLVTTSYYSGVLQSGWDLFKGSNYPDVDYADAHIYAEDGLTIANVYDGTEYGDSAIFSQKLSMYRGAKQAGGPGKPVMRGEVAWYFPNSLTHTPANDLFAKDTTSSAWFHNFVWAGINPGGVIESYWVGGPTQDQIYKAGGHDHRPELKNYAAFIQNIPLSNGKYVDAAAEIAGNNLRAWGQKDVVNNRAHLWIHNSTNTWKNIQNNAVQSANGTVTISGFSPNTQLTVQWWDTYTGAISSTQTLSTDGQGKLALSTTLGITAASSPKPDVAVKIGNYDNTPPPSTNPTPSPSLSPSPTPFKLGDTDGDNDVDIFDYNAVVGAFGLPVPPEGSPADFDHDSDVDIFDYNVVVGEFGT